MPTNCSDSTGLHRRKTLIYLTTGFENKYGLFGENLRTEKEKAEEKEKGTRRLYMLGDVPEYKEISDLYFNESRALGDYRDDCKNKALELFSKWFWDLWD